MKRSIILLFLVISVHRICGQSGYLVAEWGMIKYADTLIVDQTEITCGEYLDYLYYQDLSFENYLLNKPLNETEIVLLKQVSFNPDLLPDPKILDSLDYAWLFKKCNDCSTYTFESLVSLATIPMQRDSMETKIQKKRISDLLQLPIVGVSFEQAQKFCHWRTKRGKQVSRLRYHQKRIIEYDTTDIIYSFPSPIEVDLLNPGNDSISSHGKARSNYNYKNSLCLSGSDQRLTLCERLMAVHSFNKIRQSLGSVVDIQGNVAEMTSTKGISKGGSYLHFARESMKGREIFYQKPEKWLGFRCVGKVAINSG